MSTRYLNLVAPFGTPDDLEVERISGREELGRLPEYHAVVTSKKKLKAADVLGKNVTVAIGKVDSPRYVNGYVVRFSEAGREKKSSNVVGSAGEVYRYHLHISAWLWFLTRTATSRIYQKQTFEDVVKKVFEFNKFAAEAEYKAVPSIPKREYCVQYRETDFNFVSRLLEQEGLYYYVKHDNGKHKLVVCGGIGAHSPVEGEAKVNFLGDSATAKPEDECMTEWATSYEVEPGRYTVKDFNFETPKLNVQGVASGGKGQAFGNFEIYDYPGEVLKVAEAEAVAKTRLKELDAQYEVYHGSGKVTRLVCGATFQLIDHWDKALNQEYLVTGVSFEAINNSEASGGAAADYHCSVTAIKKTVPYVPPRVTPKPVVQGLQTAFVVGPSGEEIFVDKYGRVKVQFHWDREGKYDDNSSCFVRVSQAWAGKQHGLVALPRIGMEVIVAFLEGDPDQPLVTGAVYNADNMPPYALPDNKTITALRTRSSKGGGADNFSELAFEDKKGNERIFLRAEKDRHTIVKHEEREWIKDKSHLRVDKDRFTKIGGTDHLKIEGDRNEAVTGAMSLKVQEFQGKSDSKFQVDAGQEIHLKAGTTVVIEAGTMLGLKVGGNFITINSGGIFIKGTMVMINSGGAAASGSGSSPTAPTAPEDPADHQGGTAMELPAAPSPPTPNTFGPQATALQRAAENGTPFCEVCEKAKAEAAARGEQPVS